MVTAQTKFCVDSSHRHVTTVLCFADVFFSRFSFSHFTTLKFYAAHSVPTFSFPHIFSICAWSACLCACLLVITMNCAIKWLILSRCHLRRGLVSLGNHVFAVGPYHPAGRGSFGGHTCAFQTCLQSTFTVLFALAGVKWPLAGISCQSTVATCCTMFCTVMF